VVARILVIVPAQPVSLVPVIPGFIYGGYYAFHHPGTWMEMGLGAANEVGWSTILLFLWLGGLLHSLAPGSSAMTVISYYIVGWGFGCFCAPAEWLAGLVGGTLVWIITDIGLHHA
jgi:hypothetical protein